MLMLFYFEVRKNYFRKFIIIALFSFLILNPLLIYKNYINGYSDLTNYFMPHSADTEKHWLFYENMHKRLDGILTNEKANFIVNENKRLELIISDDSYSKEYQPDSYTGYFWGDYAMINKYFYDPMKYMATYTININKSVDKARDNIAFYEKHGNYYEKNKNRFIVDNYSNREINAFYDSRTWGLLFDYDFSDLLILLLMLLGFVPMFINEKETKMSSLILTCKNGKINMTLYKALSALAFIVFLVFIFSCENIATFNSLYGLDGYSMPVYAIEKYQYTPLNCTIGSFYFLQGILKTIGFFSFAMMIFLLSALFNRIIHSYMASALFMAGGIYVSGYLASVEFRRTFLSILSPFTLLKGNELYAKLLDINILYNFALRSDVCIIMQTLIASILYLIISKMTGCKALKVATMSSRKGGA